MAAPIVMYSGTCRACLSPCDGAPLIYNYKADSYQCKDCFWDEVLNGNTNLDESSATSCDNCGEELSVGSAAYCYSCYESASENHVNACDNCGDNDESVYCSSCHGGDSVECDNCSKQASNHFCETHNENITCHKCFKEKPIQEFLCASCAGTSTTTVVSDDGSSITIGDTEIAWVN